MGAASYCGIPLTHRGHSQSVRFVTGHRVEQSRELDWPELARSDQPWSSIWGSWVLKDTWATYCCGAFGKHAGGAYRKRDT